MTRIVTTAYRPKRPRQRKAVAIAGLGDAAMRVWLECAKWGHGRRLAPLIVVALLLVVLTFVSTVVIARSELARSGHMNNAAATPLR